MSMTNFVHLHVHSNFSFKDATPHPHELIKAAAYYEMPAAAITDHVTLAGAIRFYRAAEGSGVRPIIGSEIELGSGHHLTLLAENLSGYSNLCRLISRLHLSQPGQQRPVADLETLHRYRDNLICLSGCAHSQLSQDLLAGKRQEALDFLRQLTEIFPNSCYVELENPRLPETPDLLAQLAQLAEELQLPLVATNNVHFMRRKDHPIRDLLTCMGENQTIYQPNPWRHRNNQRYFKNSRVMSRLFASYPDALANTLVIAERCQLQLPLGEYRFPYFNLPEGQTAESYLRQLCEEGARARYGRRLPPAVTQRLEHELQVITQLGFCEYFLVVWDIVNFARQNGIRCAGRGSAADSLVTYLLGITAIDPIEYDLLFERFLNPERKGMPDIDIDFDSNRRDEVLAYVYEKYSTSNVAMVGTVNTISARSALREVAKAMALPKAEIDRLARFLPHISADRIEEAIAELPELAGEFPKGEPWDTLVRFCAAVNDFPRHLSVHLGGMVISREPLTDLVPLQWSAKGVIISQYDKDDIEALGLVKMDLLGLRILSAVEDTVQDLQQEGIRVDLAHLPLDDPAVYALLRSTKTVGVFQLESPGMRELLGKLQPTEFADLIANISLMRPGPMQANMVEPFIKRRHGREPVLYAHPCLEPILGSTYGVIIYQEQVLQIASALAGFTLGQADLLRRFMTHDRSKEEIAGLEGEFVQGAKARGVSEQVAREVFRQLTAFAAYGFNKAHAATFGLTGYHTAYLKAHYPAHFLTALLNNQPMGFYPPRVLLHEARLLGIPIHPIDINASQRDFTVEKGGIRVGLRALQGLNDQQIAAICQARAERAFTSFDDFMWRVALPEQAVENLIRIGAFRQIAPGINLLAELAAYTQQGKQRKEGQFTLPLPVMQADGQVTASQPVSLKERIFTEMELTGLYISGHPLSLYRAKLQHYGVIDSQLLRSYPNDERVRIAGIVVSRQKPPTRSKQRVIFLTIEDEVGLVEVTVFSNVQKKYAQVALGATLLLVEGTTYRTGPESITVTAEHLFDLRRVAKEI
ncbi:MAG: DNA polymerase III subunit alpha [Bacillota bacterium]|jgi:error-prone DNA polymerase